jgi:hypothetical protein
VFLHFQVRFVDSITQTKPSSFQFPTLELGLTGSCRYRDEINSKNKLNGTFFNASTPFNQVGSNKFENI